MNGWKNWETCDVANYFGDEAQELVNEHGKTKAAEEALYELVDNDVPDRSDWLTNVYNAFMQEVDWHEIIQAQDDPSGKSATRPRSAHCPTTGFWMMNRLSRNLARKPRVGSEF